MTKKPKKRTRTRPGELPRILHLKARNLAYILIKGRKYYLGPYDGVTVSQEVQEERLRRWHEYLASQKVDPNADTVTIAVLVDRFLEYAKTYYIKHGRQTSTVKQFEYAAQPLLDLYASLPVGEFTPLCLRAVRAGMLESGRACRKIINDRTGYIVQIFRYGVEFGLVQETTWRALTAVRRLHAGRSGARETNAVRPVPDADVAETLRYCSRTVQDMVRIQRHTGMRPGEMLAMRAEDIYREGDVFPAGYEFPALKGCWVYIPAEHKTEHHGKIRFVILGRVCQEIITSYLWEIEGSAGEYLFCPERAVRMLRLERRRNRKTKVQPSQVNRSKEDALRKPGKRYTTDSYRTAVQRGVDRRNAAEQEAAEKEGRTPRLIERWFPNQLRHAKATELRAKYGPETAQVVLGHARLSTTEIYAEKVKSHAVDAAVAWG